VIRAVETAELGSTAPVPFPHRKKRRKRNYALPPILAAHGEKSFTRPKSKELARA
jgi:hypothetical protein